MLRAVSKTGVDWTAALAGMQLASATSGDSAERIGRARQLIDRAYSEPLDLDRLASEACLSPFHFHRLFRREYGETAHQYLTRRRVERARDLLITTELSVTDICLEVGFTSLGSFSSKFRRHAGHPPSHYRRRVLASLGVLAPRPQLAPIPACFLRAYGIA